LKTGKVTSVSLHNNYLSYGFNIDITKKSILFTRNSTCII